MFAVTRNLFENVSQQRWSPNRIAACCVETLIGCKTSASTGEHLKISIESVLRRICHAKDFFVLINEVEFIVPRYDI